jgi:peptidoglycan/xylan/chitin deacetylase (PgdA/CDA1 family)
MSIKPLLAGERRGRLDINIEALCRQASRWFRIQRIVGVYPVLDQGIDQCLVAWVDGRERVIAVRQETEWLINVPVVVQEDSPLHSIEELGQAQRELTQAGYGNTLQLQSVVSGKQGIVGIVRAGGIVTRNWPGNLVELPAPDGCQAEVRWLGRAWVGGFTETYSGNWWPAVPSYVEGNEPLFEGSLAITVDDCNDPDIMRGFLAIADRLGARLTFFPNSLYVKMYPEVWAEVLGRQHEIGYHTSSHSRGDWSEEWLEQDFSEFEEAVHKAAGDEQRHVRLVRPPFGLFDHGGWQSWVESKGLTTVMWDRSVGRDAWPYTISGYLEREGSLILLAHTHMQDLDWFESNESFLHDLAGRYTLGTVSESLLREGIPVRWEGLPVGLAP